MCVVSHGYDVLGVVRDGGGGWYVCRTKPGWEVPEHFPSVR